jgi:hypothetical protein
MKNGMGKINKRKKNTKYGYTEYNQIKKYDVIK